LRPPPFPKAGVYPPLYVTPLPHIISLLRVKLPHNPQVIRCRRSSQTNAFSHAISVPAIVNYTQTDTPVPLPQYGYKRLRSPFETAAEGNLPSNKYCVYCPCPACLWLSYFQQTLTDLQEIQKRPEPWYSAGLADDSNIYEWEVTIIG
jgi:hypothetical protein